MHCITILCKYIEPVLPIVIVISVSIIIIILLNSCCNDMYMCIDLLNNPTFNLFISQGNQNHSMNHKVESQITVNGKIKIMSPLNKQHENGI